MLCGNIPTANATVYVIDSVLMPTCEPFLRRRIMTEDHAWTRSGRVPAGAPSPGGAPAAPDLAELLRRCGAGRPGRVRPAVRRHLRPRLGLARPGRPRPGPGRGGRPGGLPRDLADVRPVRPRTRQRARLAAHDRAPQGGRPGPLRRGSHPAGPDVPPAEPAGRARRDRRGRPGLARGPPGPRRAGRPHAGSSARRWSWRTSGATHTRRWRPCSTSGRHRQDPDPGRADPAARHHGGGDMSDIHALSGAYAVDALDDTRARPVRASTSPSAPTAAPRSTAARGRRPAGRDHRRDAARASCATGCSPTSPPCGRCRRRRGHRHRPRAAARRRRVRPVSRPRRRVVAARGPAAIVWQPWCNDDGARRPRPSRCSQARTPRRFTVDRRRRRLEAIGGPLQEAQRGRARHEDMPPRPTARSTSSGSSTTTVHGAGRPDAAGSDNDGAARGRRGHGERRRDHRRARAGEEPTLPSDDVVALFDFDT